MSKIIKDTSTEEAYNSIADIAELPADNLTNSTKLSYRCIKRLLTDELKQAQETGKVYWDLNQVVDRPIEINGFAGKVRYIPTFAYRQTRFSLGALDSCALCSLSDNRIQIINPNNVGDFDEFNNSFNVYPNKFPYLDRQVLLSSAKHIEFFTEDQYKIIFDFMESCGFAGAGMQLKYSGASIPKHAHISIFDEVLPIFNSDYRPLKDEDGTIIATSTNHPAVCYKIFGGTKALRLYHMKSITQKLTLRGLSFNLYFDNQANVYIIPRTNLNSTSMGIIVGQAEVAGIFNSYVDHSETTDIEELKQEYWKIFKTVTGEQIAQAIKDTAVANEYHECTNLINL